MRKGFEKRFNVGDIVYWCHREGHMYDVHFGMVDEQFSDVVIVDYLAPMERRLVNGIPIDKFESESHYKKLPKGWTYNTELFELTWKDLTQEERDFSAKFSIKNPDCIKEAYNKGYLVKDSTIYHGIIESEITKDGYRIVKKYPMYQHHIDHVSVRPDKLYFTYDEAEKEVDDNIAEFKRQASLSDYEWSVEQIDKTIGRWKIYHDASDKEAESYHNWLVGMENVEDIETRIFSGQIQWKYWKNKKWNNIEL